MFLHAQRDHLGCESSEKNEAQSTCRFDEINLDFDVQHHPNLRRVEAASSCEQTANAPDLVDGHIFRDSVLHTLNDALSNPHQVVDFQLPQLDPRIEDAEMELPGQGVLVQLGGLDHEAVFQVGQPALLGARVQHIQILREIPELLSQGVIVVTGCQVVVDVRQFAEGREQLLAVLLLELLHAVRVSRQREHEAVRLEVQDL
mmetsp:Transcript_9564/g.17954  ORF Transcript_9564/g.17954 Transcript_9564/m.17954 type:complete len:202 (+) Transcript_9564:94-699(+)